MLRQRVLTAVILLLIIITVVIGGDYRAWVVLATVLTLPAMGEYARLTALSAAGEIILLAGGVLLLALVYYYTPLPSGPNPYSGLALSFIFAFFWLGVIPLLLTKKIKLTGNFLGAVLCGWLLFIPLWLGFINLFAPFKPAGFTGLLEVNLAVLYLILLVWTADIAAYFVGKRWGKIRLAPELSPGKSREGLIGAVSAAVIYSALYYLAFSALIYGSNTAPAAFNAASWLASDYFSACQLTALAVLAVPLTLISVLGDLWESSLKRQAGVKDSGMLLPGHGGFFDRLDSLTAVLAFYPLLSWALFFGQTYYQQ